MYLAFTCRFLICPCLTQPWLVDGIRRTTVLYVICEHFPADHLGTRWRVVQVPLLEGTPTLNTPTRWTWIVPTLNGAVIHDLRPQVDVFLGSSIAQSSRCDSDVELGWLLRFTGSPNRRWVCPKFNTWGHALQKGTELLDEKRMAVRWKSLVRL